jgi:hypothetical protein
MVAPRVLPCWSSGSAQRPEKKQARCDCKDPETALKEPKGIFKPCNADFRLRVLQPGGLGFKALWHVDQARMGGRTAIASSVDAFSFRRRLGQPCFAYSWTCSSRALLFRGSFFPQRDVTLYFLLVTQRKALADT